MKTIQARSVSSLARVLTGSLGALILAAAIPAWAAPPVVAAPTSVVYNPSAEVRFSAVITGVRRVPDGPLAGVHVTAQSKTGVTDIFLAPADFLKIFHTDFKVGAGIQVIGSRVQAGGAEVVIAREVTEGDTTLTLRDFGGAPVWEHWGAVADPAVAVGA